MDARTLTPGRSDSVRLSKKKKKRETKAMTMKQIRRFFFGLFL